MKINSAATYSFTGTEQNVNFDASNKKKKEKKYVDPLANWPMRGLGYTNDIGVAINEIAPTAATLFWVPALMYFGADIYDKYKNKGNKYDPNGSRAFSQAIFQACASVILPTIVGHVGQSAFSTVDKLRGAKLSTNAKEQTLRFIKRHTERNEVFNPQSGEETILENFEKRFNVYCEGKKEAYSGKNIFVKLYDNLLANSKKGALANSNDAKLKKFALDEFKNVLANCKNREAVATIVDKKIFKLKAWKSLGAFTALLLTVKPIDTFTENIIIKRVVKPQIARFNGTNNVKMEDFGKKKEEPKSERII